MMRDSRKTRLNKLYITALFLAIGLMVVLESSQAAETNRTRAILTFGVVPQQSATKLANRWTPILSYLGEKTGYRIDFKTAKDIPTFEKRCATGEYDLAYMNPYHYTVFHETPGYRVIAKENLKHLKGIIVVHKDSPYQDLSKLHEKTLAFPSPTAFAASVLTRAHLDKNGIHFTPRYVSSHDSVYRAVAKGLYPAGGGVPRTLKNVSPDIKDQLRILWTSKGYSPHAITAHPGVSDDVVKIIVEAMLAMNQDPRGKELFGAIEFKGLVPALDQEYDDVRKLGIKSLQELLK